MKRFLLSISIIILIISVTFIIFLNINININKNKNQKFLGTYNSIFTKQYFVYSEDLKLPKIEMNSTDYIGVINIVKDNLLLPIESECNDSFINIKSACNCSNEKLIIMGTNLKDSFNSYKMYDVNDRVIFTNTLGYTFQYVVKSIKRINRLNNINNHDEDLIIIIKDYYSLEYILFLCELD